MTELIILPDPPVVKWHEEDTDPDCVSIVIDWSEFTRSVLAFRRSNTRCLEILKQLHAVTGQVIQDIQEVQCQILSSESREQPSGSITMKS